MDISMHKDAPYSVEIAYMFHSICMEFSLVLGDRVASSWMILYRWDCGKTDFHKDEAAVKS